MEFTLVAPFLCFMMLAMIYVGLYLGTAHSVSQIASDVSRYSVVGRDKSERRALAEKWVATAGATYSLLDLKRMSLQMNEVDELLKITIAYDISYIPMPTIVSTVVDFQPSIVRTAAVHLP